MLPSPRDHGRSNPAAVDQRDLREGYIQCAWQHCTCRQSVSRRSQVFLKSSCTHLLTYSLIQSPTHPPHSLTHSLTHPRTRSLTHSLTHALTCYSPYIIHSLTDSLRRSLHGSRCPKLLNAKSRAKAQAASTGLGGTGASSSSARVSSSAHGRALNLGESPLIAWAAERVGQGGAAGMIQQVAEAALQEVATHGPGMSSSSLALKSQVCEIACCVNDCFRV